MFFVPGQLVMYRFNQEELFLIIATGDVWVDTKNFGKKPNQLRHIGDLTMMDASGVLFSDFGKYLKEVQ